MTSMIAAYPNYDIAVKFNVDEYTICIYRYRQVYAFCDRERERVRGAFLAVSIYVYM